MPVSQLITAIGSIGVFQARAFLPAFVTAALLRIPERIPFIGETLARMAENTPAWFTHDITLVLLGGFSIMEIAANKSEEAREFMDSISHYVKAIMAAVVAMGILGAQDKTILDPLVQEAGVTHIVLILIAAIGTFVIARMRSQVDRALLESDPEDVLSIQRLMSWMDDLWGVLGVLLLIVAPIVVLIIVALIIYVLARMRDRARRSDAVTKIPCVSCRTDIYRAAVECPSCHHDTARPQAVGLIGQTLDHEAPDIATHKLSLLEKKRCPSCAAHLHKILPQENCSECGHEIFSESDDPQAYLARISMRLPLTLLLCFLLSLIPILGAIPGIVLYRFRLVMPFVRYLGFGERLVTKWLVRAVVFLLLMIQWIPGVGGISVPLMAIASYIGYRRAFKKMLSA